MRSSGAQEPAVSFGAALVLLSSASHEDAWRETWESTVHENTVVRSRGPLEVVPENERRQEEP